MGGDHKCPLCSATFTRPQHVGRHLRAHTGDRPYECKECPLRFARSDLLSRHVNKAHKTPDEDAPEKKTTKKGRRKSFPASALPTSSDTPSDQQKPPSPVIREKSRAASFSQQAQLLQAQSIYPHHPLLSSTTSQPFQAQTWNADPSQAFAATAGMTNFPSTPYSQAFVNPAAGTGNPNAILGNPTYPNPPSFEPPFTAAPMRMTGSDQGHGSMGRNSSPNMGGITYEWGFKKRACDQCNHSKVRCDFADPCLRCTHRNLKCSYNKPQRSRTIGYPLVPSQANSYGALNTSPQVSSTMSVSPQSHFSSPHSTSSPIAPHEPLPHTAHRKSSVSSLPPNVPKPPTHNNALQWNTYPVPHNNNSNFWPTMQPPGNYTGADTVSGSITGQFQESPGSMNAALQSVPPYQSSAQPVGYVQSLGVSPPQATAPTPSLTSNTTSPSDLDELPERRTSYTGTSATYGPDQWRNMEKQNDLRGAPTLHTFNSDPTFIVPPSTSPSQMSPTQMHHAQFDQSFQSELTMPNTTMHWPQSRSGNSQWRQNVTTDDDNTSALSSSASSTLLELNDAQMQAIQHQRRRSSAGTWANALEKMSIQDTGNSTESSSFPTSVQQEHYTRRPTHPTLSGVKEGNESAIEETLPMPSLSDVKDLWRIFMTDPMTGLTPAGEKVNEFEGAPLVTPRPGLGKRTLSKSNSMPDLLSPQVNVPNFFSTFLNGLTPRPTEQQQSYLPAQQPAADEATAADNTDVGKWSKEIQQRQSSFNLQSQLGAKLGKGQTVQQQHGPAARTSMQPPAPQATRARPLPSVVQRSSALQQTLAPERVPSFGLPQAFEAQSTSTTYSKLGLNKMAHGFPPAEARPGNKRLASQTLIPGDGKKATFSLWDEDMDATATNAHTNAHNPTGLNVSTPHSATDSLDPALLAMSQDNGINQRYVQNNLIYHPSWTINTGMMSLPTGSDGPSGM
ncbi:hypothetical protein IAR55_001032 [Kwoniella newhampshirensis]|uniref:Zn(2)-C6 fungal-type domain-containing protein n=1 Tax=Kwoniella newhampshirensis TaxID=1651941 RepID=A0AAW0Z4I3_9TREE